METQPLLGERRKPNRRIWIVSLCFVVTLLLLLFPTRAPDLNILCLGDSLTQGITDGQDHPYTIELAKRFKESGIFVRIDNIGVSGDRVLPPGRMRPRLTYALAQAERQHLKYDWVLILGGINDLGVHEEAHRLFYGLRNLWRISTTHGAHVLAMNMLEWSLEAHDPVLKANVSAYNHLIETHSKQVPFVAFYDLRSDLPYFDLDPEKRQKYWLTDGLHLKPAGYDRVGELVYEKLSELRLVN